MNVVDFLTRHQESYKSISHSHATQRRQKFRRYGASRSVGPQASRIKRELSLDPRPKSESLWNQRNAGQSTEDCVEFDRQLDKVAVWLETWDHCTKCKVLEAILRRSGSTQLRFLFTVLQPSLHRDLMYTAHTHFPDTHFTPISTHASRELKEKLSKLNLVTFHRIKSSYPQGTRHSSVNKLPSIVEPSTSTSSAHTCRTSPERPQRAKTMMSLPTFHRAGLQESTQTNKWYPEPSRSVQSETSTTQSVSSSLDMHVRRHIQNENCTGRLKHRSVDTSFKGVRIHCPPHQHKKWMKEPSTLSERSLPEEGEKIITWYTQVWNDTEKNAFFRMLLLKLDPREHYFLSAFLFVRQHVDFLTQLPEKLALHVLSFLSPKELVDISRVCKAWRRLANHNSLWETKCREVKLEVSVSDNPVWKRVFKDNHFLRLNWDKGLCRVTDFKGHRLRVLAVTCDRTRVASGSADTTVRVWDMRSGKRLHVLTGHTKGVWCLQFFTQHLLVSGSFDCTIRIWNLRTGTLSRTLLGHAAPVWCLALHGNMLVSGSNDKTAKIWDISRCILLNTLIGHKAPIFAVDINESGSTIYTGSADRTVRLWCTETWECQRRICVSGTSGILSLSCSHDYFVCSHGTSICLYKGTRLLATFKEHQQRVETVKLRVDPETGEGMMVSGGQDGLCKYWDINKSDSVQTFSGHTETVNCIYFDECRIVSASYDHKIRLWNFDVHSDDEDDDSDFDEDDDDDNDV